MQVGQLIALYSYDGFRRWLLIERINTSTFTTTNGNTSTPTPNVNVDFTDVVINPVVDYYNSPSYQRFLKQHQELKPKDE